MNVVDKGQKNVERQFVEYEICHALLFPHKCILVVTAQFLSNSNSIYSFVSENRQLNPFTTVFIQKF